MSFEKFKEFFDKHPDFDNTEYYAEFPETDKGIIRSWKSRVKRQMKPEPPETPETSTPKKDDPLKKEYVKLLLTQTNSKESEFEGVDLDSTILILKNRQKDQQLHASLQPNKDKTSNTPILPTPAPIGQSKRHFGLDEYIVFDGDKNEIRMEIPMDVLFNPEKNKKLGEIK